MIHQEWEVWSRVDSTNTYSDLIVSCVPFLRKKKETFVHSLLPSNFVSTEFRNLFPYHRCRRLQMKVSHWRCLKWVSCQLFRCCFEAEVWPHHAAGWDDVLWSLHLIVSLLLNTYSAAFDHLVQIPVTTIHKGDMFATTQEWSDPVILPRYP